MEEKSIKELFTKLAYMMLSVVKGFGTAIIVLASLLIEALIIGFYFKSNPVYSDWVVQVIGIILKTRYMIFFSTWIFSTIINYRELAYAKR